MSDVIQQFPAYDVEQHLGAIHSMLGHLIDWSDGHAQRIKDSDAAASKLSSEDHVHYQICVENECIDARSESAFADAALSNAIVGALAPMYEGIFNHEFRALSTMDSVIVRSPANHLRCNLPADQFFDPYLHVDRHGQVVEGSNLREGVMQILKGLDVLDRFPANFEAITEALFTFRNRGLHFGLEWLPEKRRSFAVSVGRLPNWKRWFDVGTSGGDPWIICVTEEFMEEAFAVAVEMVNVFSRLLHETRVRMPSEVGEPPKWAKLMTSDPDYIAEMEEWILRPLEFPPIRAEARLRT